MRATTARISKRSSLRRKTMEGALTRKRSFPSRAVSGFGRLRTPEIKIITAPTSNTPRTLIAFRTLWSCVKEFPAVRFSFFPSPHDPVIAIKAVPTSMQTTRIGADDTMRVGGGALREIVVDGSRSRSAQWSQPSSSAKRRLIEGSRFRQPA